MPDAARLSPSRAEGEVDEAIAWSMPRGGLPERRVVGGLGIGGVGCWVADKGSRWRKRVGSAEGLYWLAGGGFVMVDWVWMRMGLQRCVAVTMLARPEVELLPFSLVQVGAPSIGARALPEVHVLPVLHKVQVTRLAQSPHPGQSNPTELTQS